MINEISPLTKLLETGELLALLLVLSTIAVVVYRGLQDPA